ncbi:MAG TPA: tetratricopeptide repeat protein [Terracidiphilus sp.]|jgi:tetratricopeptide (TPR) repeat protein|nr:tetratricopeptide repeat protein [Terracidiphilus sp.]
MSLLCSYEVRKHLGALFIAGFLISAVSALCQNPARTGQISGRVIDPNGSPVALAQVVLYSSQSSAEPKRTETDRTGGYSFSPMPFGAYKLSAGASGFQDSETKMVILASASAAADLTLTPLESGKKDSKTDSASQRSAPAFSAAGVRGTTAPSGYSAGLSNEETAHVRASVAETPLFNTLPGETQIDCDQEPALLHDIEKAPHDFATNHALGAFYLSHGDTSKAIQYLGAARSLVPGDRTNSLDLAVAMIGASRGSEATAILQQLLQDRGPDSTLLRLLAFAYESAGENEKAEATFENAAATDSDVKNQFDCGIGLIQLGALSPALDLFTEATKAHPGSARLWFGLGIGEHLLDHKEDAVSALLHSSDLDLEFLPPLAALAELSSLSDYAEANLHRRIAAYVVAHPEDADAHFAYALVLSKHGRPEGIGKSQQEIASQLRRALQLNPQMARARFLLGDVESEANNLSGAIDEFIEGLKLEPGNARAHYRLVLLYRRNGQQEAARKEMDAFLALHGKPGGEDATDATGSISLSMPSIQLLPAQRGCGPRPQ